MRQLEHGHQVALVNWSMRNEKKYPSLKWLHCIPNGGARNIQVARKLKLEGVKKGVSDLFLPTSRGGYHGLYIELKAGNNKPTKDQLEFIDDMNTEGYKAVWVTGWENARDVIVEYLEMDENGEKTGFGKEWN